MTASYCTFPRAGARLFRNSSCDGKSGGDVVSSPVMQPTQQPQTLPRVLGPWITTAVVVGTVIGSGVFKKGRNVADSVPEVGLALAAWALVGVLVLCGALALAEVAVLFPRAGGNYVFLRESYGRGSAFLYGWVEFWINRAASIAALATMFSDSFHDALRQALYPGQTVEVLPFWPRQILTALVIVGLAAVNARGTRLSGALQFFITVLKVGSLLFIIVLPFVVYAVVSEPSHPPRVANLTPAWPADWGGVNWAKFGAALIAILWPYHGWMAVAPVAGEVKNPQRNIPLGLLGGVLLIIGLYCGANLAYNLVLPRGEIVARNAAGELSSTPIATQFCSVLLGPVGVVVASAIIMTSVFGALNGNLLVGPRLLYAMGDDRLAPAKLAAVHPRYQTPFVATVVLAAWACFLVLTVGAMTQHRVPVVPLGFTDLDLNLPPGKSPFDVMTDFVIFGAVTFETLAVSSIFVFRRKIPVTPENRPYRCWGYPVVPALHVLGMGAVLVSFFLSPQSRTEAFVAIGFIGVGALVYLTAFRGRRP
jgi:basic amino acid/polyamine antiporter, APA family